eukprot:m.127307 g.127307  ORF g.127307 m.127307 type:complete len:458 (-) comp11208_c0_seq4:48-1421(-)
MTDAEWAGQMSTRQTSPRSLLPSPTGDRTDRRPAAFAFSRPLRSASLPRRVCNAVCSCFPQLPTTGPCAELGITPVLGGQKTNVMLLFVFPLMFAPMFGVTPGANFALSLLVLVPLAERLSFVTEQLALHTNAVLSGLLNATFGNVTELIVCWLALREGLIRVVQLSLLGSVLSNLLLVLGASFFVGGLRYKKQKFKQIVGQVNSGLLMLGVIALILPTILVKTGKDVDVSNDISSSRLCSAVLLLNYMLYLYFQLNTHLYAFADDSTDCETPILSARVAGGWLAAITVAVALVSNVLVDTITGAAEDYHMSSVFICAVLIPIAGNAAEHGAAVIFAYRNQMDIALGIALGSATQVALFVLPVCVLLGWFENQPMTLYFQPYECLVLLLAIIVTTFVLTAASGRSNWLVGVILISTYFIICVGFFDHRNENLELHGVRLPTTSPLTGLTTLMTTPST